MGEYTRFCHYCGTGPIAFDDVNTTYRCSECMAAYGISPYKEPELTPEEVIEKFNKIPLTKSQSRGKRRNWNKKK